MLRPGGVAVYTIPLVCSVHRAPQDFFRFTRYGIEKMFTSNGFEILRLEEITGFWVSITQLFIMHSYRYRKGGPINPLWWLIPPVWIILQWTALALDKIDWDPDSPWMYLLVAKKK